MTTDTVEIINVDHDPPHPYMIVNNAGMQVDFSRVEGELWDPTVRRIYWGQGMDGRYFGKIEMKNGTGRTFFDAQLLVPYLRAYKMRKADEEIKAALADQARKDAEEAARDAARMAPRRARLRLWDALNAIRPEPEEAAVASDDAPIT